MSAHCFSSSNSSSAEVYQAIVGCNISTEILPDAT